MGPRLRSALVFGCYTVAVVAALPTVNALGLAAIPLLLVFALGAYHIGALSSDAEYGPPATTTDARRDG